MFCEAGQCLAEGLRVLSLGWKKADENEGGFTFAGFLALRSAASGGRCRAFDGKCYDTSGGSSFLDGHGALRNWS